MFLPSFATASVTGSVVAAARAAELAVFRLAELGFDPVSVLSASGRAPVAPVADDEATAMARTTDALAYGSEVHLTVDESFDRFDEVPSVAAREYGEPLEGVFEDVDWDFAELPVERFGPAAVTIDVVGGDTHVVGETSEDVLAESFGLSEMRYKVAPPARSRPCLETAREALPLVPDSEADCCRAIQTALTCPTAKRPRSTTCLAGDGTGRRERAGYMRTRTDPTLRT